MSNAPKAALVAAGILCSRLAGLVRLRVFAYYFGLQSDAADAFNAAFRIPNFLQNLFGEGALSASFIPVYAGLLSRARQRDADRVAGAVASLLSLAVAEGEERGGAPAHLGHEEGPGDGQEARPQSTPGRRHPNPSQLAGVRSVPGPPNDVDRAGPTRVSGEAEDGVEGRRNERGHPG